MKKRRSFFARAHRHATSLRSRSAGLRTMHSSGFLAGERGVRWRASNMSGGRCHGAPSPFSGCRVPAHLLHGEMSTSMPSEAADFSKLVPPVFGICRKECPAGIW